MEQIESDRVEINMAWDNKVIDNDCGYFFSGAVSEMTSLLEDRTLVAPSADADGRYLMLVHQDFPTEAADRLPGEVVDVAEWPNAPEARRRRICLPFNGNPVEQGAGCGATKKPPTGSPL